MQFLLQVWNLEGTIHRKRRLHCGCASDEDAPLNNSSRQAEEGEAIKHISEYLFLVVGACLLSNSVQLLTQVLHGIVVEPCVPQLTLGQSCKHSEQICSLINEENIDIEEINNYVIKILKEAALEVGGRKRKKITVNCL